MVWEKVKEYDKIEKRVMKKFMNSFAAALVMLAAAGCEKNGTPPGDSSTPAYIENGVCYGYGIELPSTDGTLIWAPVNCGYDESHKYGLMYQWGRKYGQGYTGENPAPTMVNGQLASAADGSSDANKNNFYTGNSNWLSSQADDLWCNDNSGASSTKTAYDPCPDGWRVPTNAELVSLVNGRQWTDSSEDSNHNGVPGFWFYGNATPSEDGAKVFFPAAGSLLSDNGSAGLRGSVGLYWTSSVYDSDAWYLYMEKDIIENSYDSRAHGQSVRCVKDAAK